MTTICHPSSTDWTCLTEDQRTELDLPDNAAAKEMAEAQAWVALQSLLAYRLDICPDTVRPCTAGCAGGRGYESSYPTAPVSGFGQPFAPYLVGGQWFNFCGCQVACNCGPALQRIFLPGPVGGIDEVRMNGAVIPPSAYRVDNGNELVRIDGNSWPSCQDMTAGPDDDDTFFVSYFRGMAPNPMFNAAAGSLAWEFFLACTNQRGCRLPSGVTSITRQGVSMEIDRELWTNGKSGVDEVDRIVALFNPAGLRQQPMIVSPESLQLAPRRSSWSI